MQVRPATPDDRLAAKRLMRLFVARGELLRRTDEELLTLIPNAFLAERNGTALGFAALEIYSPKLSEVQCLSFTSTSMGEEVVRELVRQCVARARQRGVLEVMAVVPVGLTLLLQSCGFRVALPNQRRAMFVRPAETPHAASEELLCDRSTEITFRDASAAEADTIRRYLQPFVDRNELLLRTPEQMNQLLQHGFVAEDQGRIIGFVALEIYSPKLAELQCLAVDPGYRGRRIGRRLVSRVIARAQQYSVKEVMAITSRDEVLRACGFDDCLPGSKAALFLRTR